MFRLDSVVDWLSPNYSTSTLILPLRKSLPIDRAKAMPAPSARLLAVDCYRKLFNLSTWKRRRILKKGDSYAIYTKKPLTALYFNYYLALVDRAVHLSILLDFDRCPAQITAWYHYDSATMVPKMPTMENFQQLMVQKPCYAVDVELCVYLIGNHVLSLCDFISSRLCTS